MDQMSGDLGRVTHVVKMYGSLKENRHMKLPTRLSLAINAFQRRHLTRPNLKGIDLWIASPGGVGTTFLMEYIKTWVKTNDVHDMDGLKHWPKPPVRADLESAPQMIFVTGNPDDIVASIVRRRWLRTQSAKIGSVGGALLKGRQQHEAFRRAVHSQISAWKSCGSDKVLVVEYDDIWRRSAEIARHARIHDASFNENFPPRRQRKSVIMPVGTYKE
jgi:hypothetical protein